MSLFFLKIQLDEKNDLLQKRDNEIIELNRQLRELQRQLREEADTNNHLKNKLTVAEEENQEKERENEVRERERKERGGRWRRRKIRESVYSFFLFFRICVESCVI